jgi:ubiquinone/menaquinone biosynthesis C-methylase UbiE
MIAGRWPEKRFRYNRSQIQPVRMPHRNMYRSPIGKLLASGAFLMLAVSYASAQVAAPANEGYRTPEGRARVAATLDAPDRQARQKPEELVGALAIEPGSTVVDLGTGPGFMLPYLSRAVGPNGKVIAEDIQTDFLDKARAKARSRQLANVEFLLGTETDPKLPEAAADLVLVLDAYHHFDYPARMLSAIAKALRPGGRLAIVEFYKRRGSMGPDNPDRPLQHIRLDADDVVKEIEGNGFRLLSRRDHVPNSQYIAIFERR